MGNHMIDMCQKDIHIIVYEFVRQELYSFWHALITLLAEMGMPPPLTEKKSAK